MAEYTKHTSAITKRLKNSMQRKDYAWLKLQPDEGLYLDPHEYSTILKRYIFDGKDDLAYLQEAVQKEQKVKSILEFGCGSARATMPVLEALSNYEKIDLVDLSRTMLEHAKSLLADYHNVNTVQSDTIDFINSTESSYDLVFSMWSLSHSVHQHLKIDGLEKGVPKIEAALNRLFTKTLNVGGLFFLTHFDSLSDEQRPSISQRKRDNPVFHNPDKQSPSKLAVDAVLEKLQRDGIVEAEVSHLIGEPLVFENTEAVLEYYMNFHMECHFNQNPDVEEILNSLEKDLSVYKNEDGAYKIKPGCFIYKVRRLI